MIIQSTETTEATAKVTLKYVKKLMRSNACRSKFGDCESIASWLLGLCCDRSAGISTFRSRNDAISMLRKCRRRGNANYCWSRESSWGFLKSARLPLSARNFRSTGWDYQGYQDYALSSNSIPWIVEIESDHLIIDNSIYISNDWHNWPAHQVVAPPPASQHTWLGSIQLTNIGTLSDEPRHLALLLDNKMVYIVTNRPILYYITCS